MVPEASHVQAWNIDTPPASFGDSEGCRLTRVSSCLSGGDVESCRITARPHGVVPRPPQAAKLDSSSPPDKQEPTRVKPTLLPTEGQTGSPKSQRLAGFEVSPHGALAVVTTNESLRRCLLQFASFGRSFLAPACVVCGLESHDVRCHLSRPGPASSVQIDLTNLGIYTDTTRLSWVPMASAPVASDWRSSVTRGNGVRALLLNPPTAHCPGCHNTDNLHEVGDLPRSWLSFLERSH